MWQLNMIIVQVLEEPVENENARFDILAPTVVKPATALNFTVSLFYKYVKKLS